MSEAKRESLKAARRVLHHHGHGHGHRFGEDLSPAQRSWSKLRLAVNVTSAFKAAGRAAGQNNGNAHVRALQTPLLQSEAESAPPPHDFEVLVTRMKDGPVKTVMLVSVVLCIIAGSSKDCPAWITFWLSFTALIPLSSFLGQATEDISSYTSEIMAGLLNATLGNVVEMMVIFMALLRNKFAVVQATLLGSILSNLLFVLGCCFMYGGSRNHELKFNSKAATTCSSLLLLAVVALVLPTTVSLFMKSSNQELMAEDFVTPVSRYTSVVIFFLYIQFLYFQLFTHKDYFHTEDGDVEDDDEPKWSMKFSIFILTLTSLVTAYVSDFLVASIEGYSQGMHLNESFIGLILVASVGNVPEFYVTLMVAASNKLDLALTIAVGSSCQMALFVTPFAVLVGWALGKDMTLDFHGLQVICLILAVLVVSTVIQDGNATWIQGSLLVASYVIIAIIYYLLPADWHP